MLQVITLRSLRDQADVRQFFTDIVDTCLDQENQNTRIDFLQCPIAQNKDATQFLELMTRITGVSIGMTKDVMGPDIIGNVIKLDDGSR